VNYINTNYGNSSAYYRDSARGNRPVFYVFQSLNVKPYTGWSAIEPLVSTNILLTQTTDQSKVTPYFSGLYNYAIGPNKTKDFQGMASWAKDKGVVWAPSIGPGFINKKAEPKSKAVDFGRDNGDFYDQDWQSIFDSGSLYGYVSITSFNEWHEGSVIEPATSSPPAGINYLTFDGSWSKNGTEAEVSYLERTKFYVDKYTKLYQG